jgi:elongation factor P
MISTSEFRNGGKIELDGDPYTIVEFQFVKPGKGGAFVKTRLKSLKTGNVLDKNFRSGEKFEEPDILEREAQYMYASGKDYYFMDTQSYEQFFLSSDQLGDAINFLKENMAAQIVFYQGKPLSVELPMFVELKIAKTDPGVRGDTATGGAKQATLETGAMIKVPLYMEEGQLIKIDTRTGTFVERVR